MRTDKEYPSTLSEESTNDQTEWPKVVCCIIANHLQFNLTESNSGFEWKSTEFGHFVNHCCDCKYNKTQS